MFCTTTNTAILTKVHYIMIIESWIKLRVGAVGSIPKGEKLQEKKKKKKSLEDYPSENP